MILDSEWFTEEQGVLLDEEEGIATCRMQYKSIVNRIWEVGIVKSRTSRPLDGLR